MECKGEKYINKEASYLRVGVYKISRVHIINRYNFLTLHTKKEVATHIPATQIPSQITWVLHKRQMGTLKNQSLDKVWTPMIVVVLETLLRLIM